MVTQPQVLLGGSKSLFTAYALLPKSWYDRVREVATAPGVDCDVSDEAAFRLFDSTGSIIGILALHGDIQLVVALLLCSMQCV
jgi:hypothetical protein